MPSYFCSNNLYETKIDQNDEKRMIQSSLTSTSHPNDFKGHEIVIFVQLNR